MCNYSLAQLAKLDIPGLPPLRNDRQIVFARPRQRRAEPPTHTFDIMIVTWDELKRERSIDQTIPYSASYESDVCIERTGLGRFWAEPLLTVEMQDRTKKNP